MKQLNLAKARSLIFILILIIFSGGIGFRLGEKSRMGTIGSGTQKTDLSMFWHVWSLLEDKYLDQEDLKPEKMINGAISGMVSSLGDPYTAYFSPEDNKINKENLNGEFGGVGIQLGYIDQVLAVIAPLDDTPADRAGVEAGDLILNIKDENKEVDRETNNLSLPEAVKIIRGPIGSKVVLTLARKGEDQPLEIEVVRGKITIPSLVFSWLENEGKKIAYIRLLQFSEVMYRQWDEMIGEIAREDNLDFGGVILDLRNNPGGFLQGAVYVAGEFIDEGVIVKQEYSTGQSDVFRVNRRGKLLSAPLVILVNRGSASAAEILAGALQYYDRGVVIGETTFGKGTVQEPEALPGGAGLHVTVSRWLLPGGKNIHKGGIDPDIEITGEDEKDMVLEKGKEEVVKIDR